MFPTKLGSFGQAVSESKNFLGIDQSASITACDGHVWYEGNKDVNLCRKICN
jgi:hypothetical protein